MDNIAFGDVSKGTLMEQQNGSGNLLRQVTQIPTRILRNHDLHGLAGLLLHHLCSGECFNLSKAAYFVDNPDFDQLVGVAGFSRSEATGGDVWAEPAQQAVRVEEGAFHKTVRGMHHASIARKGDAAGGETQVKLMAQELGIENPQVYTWDMKHGNKGVLLYDGGAQEWETQDLYNAASLLSFCPM